MKKRYTKKEKSLAKRVLKWVGSDTLRMSGDDVRLAWRLDLLIGWQYPTPLCEKLAKS